MLVLLGPPFQGTDTQFAQLSQATGIVAYDLRRKLRSDGWGVVRALGDALQASALADSLAAYGHRVAVVDPAVGYDPARRIVALEGLTLRGDQIVLVVQGREMVIACRALLTIVRGEVHTRDAPASLRPRGSSSTFRAVVPSASDVAMFREQHSTTEFDAFQAADLHFVTAPWIGRIDAKAFDFDALGVAGANPVEQLDLLCGLLAERAGGLRIDRQSRVSSVASVTARPSGASSLPPPAPHDGRPGRFRVGADARFDAYSRLIGEAERLTRKRRGSTVPPA